MKELTIDDLKFAREIGATHWSNRYGVFHRDGGVWHESSWVKDLPKSSFKDWPDIIKIDFTPLDEFEASQKQIPPPEYNPSDVAFKTTSDDSTARSKYHREIKPGVWVDVYDVLKAWGITNPAQQHLAKKALQGGERGHKTYEQDMKDIIASAKRAIELNE